MWISLNELNTIIFDESSLKMVNEINKNIDKRYYKVYVCKKDIKNKLVSFKMEFCKFCTLLEAKVEFNKILNNEKYTFKDESNKVNFKEIALVDVEKGIHIKEAYIDKKDLDNILNAFYRDRWIDDNIDVSHVKLGIRLGGIIEEYEEMIDNEDPNVSLLQKNLESIFKNAYDNGEITYSDWKKLEYKYMINKNIRIFK